MSRVKKDKSEYLVKAVANAIDVLQMISDSESELSISNISKTLGLTKCNAHNILSTLEEYNYVELNKFTGNYRLGVKTFQISTSYSNKMGIVSFTSSEMKQLRDELNESIFLSVLRKGSIVYLNIVDSLRPVRVTPLLANMRPGHATPCGKAMMAHRGIEYAKSYYGDTLTKYTETTITTISDLEAELAITLERGYSVDNEEYHMGVRGVAAPILDFMGKPICALSILSPAQRINEEREIMIGRRLMEVCKVLSSKFGYMENS